VSTETHHSAANTIINLHYLMQLTIVSSDNLTLSNTKCSFSHDLATDHCN